MRLQECQTLFAIDRIFSGVIAKLTEYLYDKIYILVHVVPYFALLHADLEKICQIVIPTLDFHHDGGN